MSAVKPVRLYRPVGSTAMHAVVLVPWAAGAVGGIVATTVDATGLLILIPAIVGLLCAASTVFGRVSMNGRAYEYRLLFWVRTFEFCSGDELWSARAVVGRRLTWPGWIGCYRKPKDEYHMGTIPLRGAVFLRSEVRDEWAAVIVSECAKVGIDVPYRPNTVEKQ